MSAQAPAAGDAGPDVPGPFGLDPAGLGLLADVLAPALAPFGVRATDFLDDVGRGESVGRALGLPERLTEALYARAHALFATGRLDRAEALFRVLCILDGGEADHWMGYGICLQERGAHADATVGYATAAALRPDWAVPHYHAARLALAGEHWTKAGDHLLAFAERDAAGLPAVMRQEAARMTRALQLRDALGREAR